jgi:uncharacterized protein YhbP (UPF0306 family)
MKGSGGSEERGVILNDGISSMDGNDDRDATTILRRYLASGILLQVATASLTGKPWVVPVWYAHDDRLNIFFTSNVGRRHSALIRSNPSVAGSIVATPIEGLGQKVQGVDFEGECRELEGDDARKAYETYASRWPNVADEVGTLDAILKHESPMRMYGIRPSMFVLFDQIRWPEQPRREILEW